MKLKWADATLPARPSRSAGLLGPWSMLPDKNTGGDGGRKKEKNKNFFPVSPSPSLAPSLSFSPSPPGTVVFSLFFFFSPTLLLGQVVGWNNSTLPLPVALPASAQSAATKRFRWKRGFGGKREMITPSKRAAFSMCAHVLSFFLHKLHTQTMYAYTHTCVY